MRLAAPFFALAAAALALTGCGAATPTAAAVPTVTSAPSETATPTPTPTTFLVSKTTTCDQLVGPKEDGTLIKYIHVVANFNANDSSQGEQLRSLKSDLEGIAAHAQPDLRPFIEALWSTNLSDFKAAGSELLNRCSA